MEDKLSQTHLVKGDIILSHKPHLDFEQTHSTQLGKPAVVAWRYKGVEVHSTVLKALAGKWLKTH